MRRLLACKFSLKATCLGKHSHNQLILLLNLRGFQVQLLTGFLVLLVNVYFRFSKSEYLISFLLLFKLDENGWEWDCI